MLAPNTVLQQRYHIEHPIGKGGMGAVYRAVDTRLDCVVALKETLFNDSIMRKIFEREARLLARLRHRTLPKVIDHFVEETGQFLVMEFIPGEDLSKLLARSNGKFPSNNILTWAFRWADQLLDVLEYIHTQSPPVTHRDIKPQNLKLTPHGDVILLDFGLAKGITSPSSLVAGGKTHSIAGFTLHYAPLEQIHGAPPDPRGDLYALAATLYLVLTGVKPPDALSRAAALVNRSSDPLRLAHEINPQVPHEVAGLLHNALALNIDERVQSAAAMRAALRDSLTASQLRSVGTVKYNNGTMRHVASYALGAAGPLVTVQPITTPEVQKNNNDGIHDEERLESAYDGQSFVEPAAAPVQTISTGAAVLALAYSSDGHTIASGGEEATVALWQTRDGSMVRTFEAHSGSVRTVALSSDTSLLATGGDDKVVQWWSVDNGQLLHIDDEWSYPIEAATFSPDGHVFASGGWGGTVGLWRVNNGDISRMASLSTGFVHSMAFSPDSQMLALGCYDGNVQLWDVAEQTLLQTLEGYASFVLSVAFSPDGKLLAASGGSSSIVIWRLSDGRLLDTFQGHTNFVRCVAFSPDARLLASGSEDKTVRLWRAHDGEPLYTFRGPIQGVTSVVFSPDGRTLAAGSHDSKIRLWRVA